MKYCCPLIAVKDIHVSRNFYEKVLRHRVDLDLGQMYHLEEDFPFSPFNLIMLDWLIQLVLT